MRWGVDRWPSNQLCAVVQMKPVATRQHDGQIGRTAKAPVEKNPCMRLCRDAPSVTVSRWVKQCCAWLIFIRFTVHRESLVNTVCSSGCLTCIRLWECLVSRFRLPQWCFYPLALSQKIAYFQTQFKNEKKSLSLTLYIYLFFFFSINVNKYTCTQVRDKQAVTRCDTRWLLIPLKHLFFFRLEAKTSQRVSSSDRPCQQPSLSCDLIRQEERAHAHGRG